MFHLADACCIFGMTMLGATHVILPAFDAKTALQLIEEEAVTATLAVPTMIEMLVDESERSGRPTAPIRNIKYGASPIRDRKSVAEGKSMDGRVDIGGRRIHT